MAELARPLQYICRSCRQQVQKSTPRVRRFATSSPRSRTLPSFTPTSSAEFDDLLLTCRRKIFTPYALAKEHRDLIYRPSQHQILLNDPGVTVTLSNDEEIKLEPAHPHDKPNKHKTLRRLAQLLGESDDPQRWNNLPGVLEGMRMAHEKLPAGFLEKVVRKAHEKGRDGVIIRCAEMVKSTGLSLSDQAVTRELMLGFHLRAAKAHFEGEELTRALKYAKQVSLMLEHEHHCGGRLRGGHVDMRRDPTVVGILLELHAADAVQNHGSQDKTGMVASFGKKARALRKAPSNPPDVPALHRQLEDLLPLWNGLKLAGQVKVDSDDAGHGDVQAGFKAMSEKVEELRQTVMDEAKGKPRRCLLMYDQLSG